MWRLTISAISLGVLAAITFLLLRWPDSDGAGPAVVAAAVSLPSAILGLFIGLRRPANRIAPLLCLAGAVPMLVVGLGDLYAAVATGHPHVLPVWPLAVGLGQGAWMLLYLPGALLMLLFPDGRLPGPRWRPVLAGLLAIPVPFAVLASMTPDPYGGQRTQSYVPS